MTDPHHARDDRQWDERGDVHDLWTIVKSGCIGGGIGIGMWVMLVCVGFAIDANSQPPPLGITFRAVFDRAVDGDTYHAHLTWPITVRMTSSSPEIRGPERPAGLESKAHLETLLKKGTPIIVSIDSADARQLGDLLTFGRVVAETWREGDVQSVDVQMIAAGHATVER